MMWKKVAERDPNLPGCGVMQRLYVGGLSHTVTQKDLKDRFGKFGDVEDVELRIKRDSEGQEVNNIIRSTVVMTQV